MKTKTKTAKSKIPRSQAKQSALDYKIESGVPIPVRNHKTGIWRMLYERMKPGDSVLLTEKESHALYQTMLRQGRGLTARRKEGEFFRVWKT